MNDTQKNFRRGGLETLIAALVLIVIVVGGLVYVAYYYSSVTGGASQQVNVQLQGSVIKVNAGDGSGSVFLKLYNEGPGGARLENITIAAKNGQPYNICFGANNNVTVYLDKCGGVSRLGVASATFSGASGAGTVLQSGSSYYLNLPAATTSTILIVHWSGTPGITTYFDPATTYSMRLYFVQGPTIDTTIQSVSSP